MNVLNLHCGFPPFVHFGGVNRSVLQEVLSYHLKTKLCFKGYKMQSMLQMVLS